MKALLSVILITLFAGCASTYHLPGQDRSRTYSGYFDDVWIAALASVDDVNLAIVETEPEHGRILARSGWTIWDLKGHVIVIVVSDTNVGYVRVDANAEAYSEETVVDFGKANRLVKKYLRALDRRLSTVTP